MDPDTSASDYLTRLYKFEILFNSIQICNVAETVGSASVISDSVPPYSKRFANWKRPYPIKLRYLDFILFFVNISAQEFVLRNYHRLYLHVLGVLDILRPVIFEVFIFFATLIFFTPSALILYFHLRVPLFRGFYLNTSSYSDPIKSKINN